MDWGEGDNALAVRPMIRPSHKAAAWQLPPHRISPQSSRRGQTRLTLSDHPFSHRHSQATPRFRAASPREALHRRKIDQAPPIC